MSIREMVRRLIIAGIARSSEEELVLEMFRSMPPEEARRQLEEYLPALKVR